MEFKSTEMSWGGKEMYEDKKEMLFFLMTLIARMNQFVSKSCKHWPAWFLF